MHEIPVTREASPGAPLPMPSPARTATFLMTDIEGSTRLGQEQHAAMNLALEVHDGLLRAAVEQSGGTVVKTTGDGLLSTDGSTAATARSAEGPDGTPRTGNADTSG